MDTDTDSVNSISIIVDEPDGERDNGKREPNATDDENNTSEQTVFGDYALKSSRRQTNQAANCLGVDFMILPDSRDHIH